jgi:hypothetical protein
VSQYEISKFVELEPLIPTVREELQSTETELPQESDPDAYYPTLF